MHHISESGQVFEIGPNGVLKPLGEKEANVVRERIAQAQRQADAKAEREQSFYRPKGQELGDA